ncbi:MAG: hypothetical protein GXO00_00835 [Candidatus Diapherotrites archaeon]|nr:hypothetical protein [Candidatus Diapherotrites archaeon]
MNIVIYCLLFILSLVTFVLSLAAKGSDRALLSLLSFVLFSASALSSLYIEFVRVVPLSVRTVNVTANVTLATYTYGTYTAVISSPAMAYVMLAFAVVSFLNLTVSVVGRLEGRRRV